MEKIKWSEKVNNEKVFERIGGKMALMPCLKGQAGTPLRRSYRK